MDRLALDHIRDEHFKSKHWVDIEDEEQNALLARVALLGESPSLASRQDVLTNESQLDTALKRLLANWEAVLDRRHPELLHRLYEQLKVRHLKF